MKNKLIYSALFVSLAMQINAAEELSGESRTRELATDILQNRVIALESHFIGHTVVLAKDGKGISIVPCKLNIDKECYRDDTGISLSQMRIEGWDVGISAMGNGIPSVPKKNESGELKVKGTQIGVINHVNYTGPNDWRFRLTVFWTGIKQSFGVLFDNSDINN